MRTTLTLEPDVAARLKQEIRRSGKGLKTLVNAVEKGGQSTVLVDARTRYPASGIAYAAALVLSADHVVTRATSTSSPRTGKRSPRQSRAAIPAPTSFSYA